MSKKLFSNIFEKSLPTNNVKEYTAFEVLPTSERLAGKTIEIDGVTNPSYIDPCTLERIIIRCTKPISECDVIVDWGDDTKTIIAEGDVNLNLEQFSENLNKALHDGTADPDYVYNEEDFNLGYQYVLEHDYAHALTTAGVTYKRFTVKIFGKDYFAIKYNHNVNSTENVIPASNLMCRVFTKDLPIASHLINFSSFCYQTARLFSVNFINSGDVLNRAKNFAFCFDGCARLVQVINFMPCSTDIWGINSLFNGCTQLIYTDFRLPNVLQTTSGFTKVFGSCNKLEVDVLDLLPLLGFSLDYCTLYGLFRNCKKLFCSDPERLGEILWNNKQNINFDSIDLVFAGCSDELRQYAPTSWGGTAPDSVINRSIEEELEETKILLAATVGDLTVTKEQVALIQEHLGLV